MEAAASTAGDQQQSGLPVSGDRCRQRRRWAVSEGRSGGSDDRDDEAQSPAVLKLVPFSFPHHINFGTVAVGTSRVRRLVLENPNAEPADVTVHCPRPASKGFTAELSRCFLQSGESILIPVTWTPLEDGPVREVITFVVNDIIKHQAILLGVARQLTKKKKSLWDTIKKRTPARQSRLKKRLPIIKNVNKDFQMQDKASIDRSPLQACENVTSNGYSILPNKDPLIILEKKRSLSPISPIVQENCRVSYTTLSVRRSTTNSALGTESHHKWQQDTKESSAVMSPCGDFVETTFGSACLKPVKAQGSDKDSVFTPEQLQIPLIHRKILSPDSFVNDSYELNEEPLAMPIVSPNQFLRENQVAVQASQEYISESVSCALTTIFSEQKGQLKVVTPYVEFQSTNKPFSGLHHNKRKTSQCKKFEQKGNETKKSNQIQICSFQKEESKKRPVLSNTVIKKKSGHPEGKGLDTVKLKSRKCLSNAIQQSVDTKSANLEILPELPVIKSISSEGKCHKSTTTPSCSRTISCNRKRKTEGPLDYANGRNEEQVENPEPKKFFISCVENEINPASEIPPSISAKRERESQKERTESLSQKWRTSKKTGKKTKKMVPVAQSQLTFVKPLKTGIPRHPMPFVAQNMFYDERWKEKQQRAFTWWLNFVLTPDDFTVKTDTLQVDAASLMLGTESCHKPSVPRAPTKEEVSLRAYTARCKLNKLRRSAYHLFTSHEMVKAIKRLEVETEAKRLLIRKDRHLWKDIGERQKILNWLLCYNPLWLRIGLEVVYGELIALESNSDVMGLAMFILSRLLWNPDIAAEYRHPTVPHLYREGHEEALSKFTLKKLLLLVCFLDHAKLSRIIDHDPCLFCKNAQFKSSKELLLAFSRDFLSGEGDLSRHLGFLGFQVNHVQMPLDEFDFSVTNLATDLQCGIRLVRALELLSSNWNLSKKLRVPAISKLQKMHNVKLALQVLKDRGIQLEDEHGAAIDAKDIVERHREKTLALLWKIVFAFQVDVLLDMNQLREEIDFLKNMLVRKAKMADFGTSAANNEGRDSSSFYSSKNCSENVKLLMDWVNAVCGFYDVKVENFTVSFSDGRVLCYLIHHYHPCYVPLEAISQHTTLTVECSKHGTLGLNSSSESDASLNLLNGTFDQTFTTSVLYKELLDNEKMNFQLINAAVSNLGGVPAMIHHSDVSNTIPDEKIVIIYVSFLCARLLELCKEIRAARLIQSAWRKHKSKTKLIQAMKQKLCATVVIQKYWRRCLAQMKLKKLRKEMQEEVERVSSVVIQTYWRRYYARRRYLKLRHYTIIIQARIRMLLAVCAYKKICRAVLTIQRCLRAMLTAKADRQRYRNLKMSALVIQSAYRRWKTHKMKLKAELQANKLAREERAAVVIQSWYRMLRDRKNYLHIRCNVIKIQALFRGMHAKGVYEQKKQCVITIQRHYRAYRLGKSERAIYLQKRLAVTVLQSAYRGMKAHLLNKQVKAAFVIQMHYRAYRKQTLQRQRFLQVKKAALCLQAAYRGYCIRKMLKRQNLAAVKIQTAFRTYAAMRKYQALVEASLVLQRWYRASKTRRKYLRAKAAVTSLQAAFRGWQVRRRIWTQHAAALTIQSAFRRYAALKRFRAVRSAARTLQHHYRARVSGRRQQQKYTALRHSVIQLQAIWRGTIVRKQIQRQNQAAVIIQSYYRMYACQTKFGRLRTAAVIIQRWYRAVGLAKAKRQEYLVLKNTVIKIQAVSRGIIARRQIQRQHQAAVSIQAMFKMHQCYGRYQTMKGAATIIQREFRAFRTGRKERDKYLQQRNAAVVLQAAYRGMSVRQEMRTLHRSAVSIQAFYRMYRERKHFQKTLAAAKRIQEWYRICKNRNIQMHKYRQMKSSALQIQSAFRGMKARVRLREMHMAATVIQRRFRTYLQRQSFVHLKTAAVIIQRKYRATILGKKQHEDYLNLRKAVVMIQCSFRGLLARKCVKQMQAAAVIIQAAFRRHRAYSRYQAIKLASTSIQLYYRSYRKTKRLREMYVKLRCSAVVLQAAYRGMKARRMLKKQHRAATVIQSHFRKYQQRASNQKIQRAVRVIQMRYKASKLRKMEVQCGEVCIRGILCGPCKRKHQAAILLQRNFRMQRELRKYLAFKSAAIVLQRRYRALILGRRQRQGYVSLCSAVVCLQSYYRGAKVRKLVCCLHSAATVIQARFRMLRAKQSYQKVRGAVIIIQRYWRSYLKGRHQRRIYLEIQKSVIKIQAIYRGVKIRQNIKAMHISATLIQSFYRMHMQRKQYKIIRWAVITIQSAYRGAVSRKIAKKMRTIGEAQSVLCTAVDYRDHIQLRNATEEVQVQDCTDKSIEQFQLYSEATCVIQQHYRSYLSMKCQRPAHLQTLKNIIIVQATVRRFIKRRRFSRMKRSVIIIQSWYRAKCQRRKYLQYCEKVIKIQRMVRKWMSCRNIPSANENFMSQQTAHVGITKFQALWRGYLCRKKNDTEEIRALRNSLVIANTDCREEKKLCNRTTFAIDCLLKYKDFSYILAALKDLETVTRLSCACCESLAQSEAVVTIFTLIRSCNRSVPCMEVIRYSVQILLNLSKYEKTTEAVYAMENSVDTLLDLLQMYREKAGDKISGKGQSIFTKICCLFVLLSKDTRRAAEIRSNPQVVARLQSLFKLTARKHEMDAQRMLAKQKSCTFLNGYSSVTVAPAVLRRRSNWTLKKDHIQEVNDPLQAIKMVIDKLGISSH